MSSIIKKIIKVITPPILHPSIFNECVNFFLREKDTITWEKNFYNRIAFINKAIQNFKNCKYLEIGVASNFVFNSIPLPMKNKIGVDPISGGTHRMTSDDFFKKNKLKFDVIFIDGLHEYEQCQRDCINSINSLNKNGIIIFHDLLPRNSFEEHVPRKQASSSGDVWKIAVEINRSKNMRFRIANIDYGVGLLKIKENSEYKKMPQLKDLRFNNFIKNYYRELPVISSEEALKFI